MLRGIPGLIVPVPDTAASRKVATMASAGRLTIKCYVGNSRWLCLCDCGAHTIVGGGSLRSGHTTSCGCFRRQMVGDHFRTHGKSGTAEHQIWKHVIRRCCSKTSPSYYKYGAKGITVCDRWRNSFADFLTDMGPRPTSKHSIDRYPNGAGNYEPGNCRWATSSEQSVNRKTTKFFDFDGQRLPSAHWAAKFKTDKSAFRRFLQKHTIEEAAAHFGYQSEATK